jgi:hypothetical protein
MKYNTKTAILAFSLIALIGMFVTGTEPVITPLRNSCLAPMLYSLHYENTIIFNLSVGFLGGVIVWGLNVLIPEIQVRSALKKNLLSQYHFFREDVIAVMLRAEGSIEADKPARLSELSAFRAYYLGDNIQNLEGSLSYLQDNPECLSDIVVMIQIFSHEIEYVLHKINIEDEDVHDFFKRLSRHIYRLQHLSVYRHEHDKYVSDFVIEILAARNIYGYNAIDPIKKIISQI